MAETRERYKKLPGRRRGIVNGASVWMGSDHLLSVRSLRFREEYRRFYLRDVQAIVVADAPRFHISTRSLLIALVWWIAYLALSSRVYWGPVAFLSAAVCLVAAWLYISWAQSCRCRIYTGVSRDELPSIYRTWTARRFLQAVEPHIAAAQGSIQGNWAEAVEDRVIGPADGPATAPAASQRRGASRTVATDVFIGALFLDSLLNFLALRNSAAALTWALYLLTFVELGSAIWIMVQRYRGLVQAAMQKLAIAALVVMGIIYYVRPFVLGVTQTTRQMAPVPPWALANMPGYTFTRQADVVACVVLALVGLALSFRRNLEPATDTARPGAIEP